MSSQSPQPISDKLEGTGFIKKHHESNTTTSFRKWCCLSTLILLSLEALVAATLIILIFVFRPKQPIFHLHSIKFKSFNLDTNSSQQFNASSSVASLVLVTENPNKLGIRYNSSELAVLYEQGAVGVIEVPVFYQPPCSRNVTVEVQVSYQPWQVINIINGISVSSNDTNNGELRIFGGIQAQPHALNFPLLTIKFYVDCRISIDYSGVGVAFSKGKNRLIRSHKAILLSNLPHVSQKCSVALCV